MNRIYESDRFDPAWNLALEEAIFDAADGGVSLYLWQNRNTVVIGRNQNAWKECRVQLLESEGGTLARRSSGGGAVYHDLGNLNFTFVTSPDGYDVGRQLSVLARAAAAFGLDAEVSGRNDVLLSGTGEKFSGNAFRMTERACLHHGTILIGVDMEKLSRYLAPSKEKLAAKGVSSVRARVTNLAAHADVDVPRMKQAMADAFCDVYGAAQTCGLDTLDSSHVRALYARYASWEWRFGRTPAFDLTLSARFLWGETELLLSFEGGRVSTARLYTDSMDETLSDAVEAALPGARCDSEALSARLSSLPSAQARALGAWLAQQRF